MPTEAFHEVGRRLSQTYDINCGKMFGKLCLKTQGKAFACLHDDDMVFKLPAAEHPAVLQLAGAQLFNPMGNRPMKEWVQVPFAHADRWPELAEAAMRYVTADNE
jgi:hypothetical protein